jgi:hypothetical protein
MSEGEYEYVSIETVQELVIWVYTLSLRIYCYMKDLNTFKEPRMTAKAILFSIAAFVLSMIFSDAFFLWLFCNSVIVWPLIQQNKSTKLWLDATISQVNRHLEDIIDKLPLSALAGPSEAMKNQSEKKND